MRTRTKKLAVIAMLTAITYVVMAVGRIPVISFLSYDPSDVIVTVGGFLFGPVASFAVSAIVAAVEMMTVSDTGPIGALMNVIQTSAFACTAAFIYKKKHTMKGAVAGLAAGWLGATVVMLLWNYYVTPVYMLVPRETVAGMLLPVFLPFNLLKGGLNAALTMLLYKPLSAVLRKSRLLPPAGESTAGQGKVNLGVILASLFIIVTGVLAILAFQGK